MTVVLRRLRVEPATVSRVPGPPKKMRPGFQSCRNCTLTREVRLVDCIACSPGGEVVCLVNAGKCELRDDKPPLYSGHFF